MRSIQVCLLVSFVLVASVSTSAIRVNEGMGLRPKATDEALPSGFENIPCTPRLAAEQCSNETDSKQKGDNGCCASSIEQADYPAVVSGQSENMTKEQEHEIHVTLSRNDCKRNIDVSEFHFTYHFKFEPITTEMIGECFIRFSSLRKRQLALQVSEIFLSQPDQESLDIVSLNDLSNFTMKTYYPNDKYHPLLLTDSHTVNAVLHFNSTSATSANSSFRIAVFPFDIQSNTIPATIVEADSVFITTELPEIENSSTLGNCTDCSSSGT